MSRQLAESHPGHPGTYRAISVDYQVIHINSEFAGQTSDHDPQVVRLFGSYRRAVPGIRA